MRLPNWVAGLAVATLFMATLGGVANAASNGTNAPSITGAQSPGELVTFAPPPNAPAPTIFDPSAQAARREQITQGLAQIFKKSPGNNSALNSYMEQHGIYMIVPFGVQTSSTDSQPSDVSLGDPSVGYDSTTGLYMITGTWQWLNNSSGQRYWYADLPGNFLDYTSSNPAPVGGFDGAALALSSNTGLTFPQGNSWDLYAYSADGDTTSWYATPSQVNTTGLDIQGQDGAWADPANSGIGGPAGDAADYSWDHGFLDWWVGTQGTSYGSQIGHNTAYIWFALQHTWNGVSISSVSLGTGGISATFSNSAYGWNAESGTGVWNYQYYY